MNNNTNGQKSGNPARNTSGISMFETMRRIRELCSEIQERKQRAGCGELYEYLLPEGSRMVHGMIFVPKGDGKLECLGTRNEVVEKGWRGGWK